MYSLQFLPFPATISTSHRLLFVFVRSSFRLARSRKAYVVECEMLSRSEDGWPLLSIPALSLPTLSGFISGTIGLWPSYSGFYTTDISLSDFRKNVDVIKINLAWLRILASKSFKKLKKWKNIVYRIKVHLLPFAKLLHAEW